MVVAILGGMAFLLLFIANSASILTGIYMLSIGCAFSYVIFRSLYGFIAAFSLNVIVAMLFYLVNLHFFPQFDGFTVSSGGFGGDDYRYFMSAKYMDLQDNFQYSVLIHYILSPIKFFREIHLVDALLVNVLGLAFIPLFVSGVLYAISQWERAAFVGFLFASFTPFIWSNGAYLLRDGLTATLFSAVFYFYIKNKYIFLFLSLSFLSYLRLGSALVCVGLFLFGFVGKRYLLPRSNARMGKDIMLLLGLGTLAIVFSSQIAFYLISKGIGAEFLFRESMLYYTLNYQQGAESSILIRVSQYPAFIRVPLATIVFYLSPVFQYSRMFFEGGFSMRGFLMNMYAVYTIFTSIFFARAAVTALTRKHVGMLALIIGYIVALMVLSQFSLQVRHKTMVMPLYYIICSYGFLYASASSKLWGWVVCLGLVGINFMRAFI